MTVCTACGFELHPDFARDAELGQLLAAFERMQEGHAQVVSLIGIRFLGQGLLAPRA